MQKSHVTDRGSNGTGRLPLLYEILCLLHALLLLKSEGLVSARVAYALEKATGRSALFTASSSLHLQEKIT